MEFLNWGWLHQGFVYKWCVDDMNDNVKDFTVNGERQVRTSDYEWNMYM